MSHFLHEMSRDMDYPYSYLCFDLTVSFLAAVYGFVSEYFKHLGRDWFQSIGKALGYGFIGLLVAEYLVIIFG